MITTLLYYTYKQLWMHCLLMGRLLAEPDSTAFGAPHKPPRLGAKRLITTQTP